MPATSRARGTSLFVWKNEPSHGAASSFAMSYWYVPTLVEYVVVAGVLAFGALLFTIALYWMPLREPETH